MDKGMVTAMASLMLVVALMGTLLTGCGKGTDSAATSSSGTETSTETSTETADTAETEKPTAVEQTMESFDEIIAALQEDSWYAFADMDKDHDALLVARSDAVFDNGDGTMAATEAGVYGYDSNGRIRGYGSVAGGGTATPLASKDSVLYVGGHSYMNKVYIDESKSELVTEEGEYFDEYEEAVVISFTSAAGSDTTDNEGGVTGTADEWVDITEDEADGLVMRLFAVPEGAESLGWMKCEALGDADKMISPVVQLTYRMNDQIFTARAQQGAPEYADISGLDVNDWTVGPEDVKLANWGEGNMEGKVYRRVNDTGYLDLITWYDIEIGIAYSLTVAAADLDGFDIQAVAEQMYSADNEPYGNIPDVPEERETADGVYGAHMLASDRDKIGTTNDAGVFYDIVYQSTPWENELCIVGSMSYKNDREQDAISISDDLVHVFTVDDNTVYQLMGGENGAEVVSAEDFANYLKDLIDTGLYVEIEVKDGVVATASIAS